MKKNLFSFLSIVSIATLFCASVVLADDPSDATTGPGIGLTEPTYNGQSRIYTMGNNGIQGDYVSEANAREIAPTSVESNIINPINNYAIDMGPTTASNWQTQLHSIDAGPGKSIVTDLSGATSIYNNVGPGVNIAASTFIDNGPQWGDFTTTNVDPSNALKDMGPKSSTEIIYSKKNKQ